MTKADSPTPEKRRRRPGQRMTKAQRREAMGRFIESFETLGNVSRACQVARIHRSTLYDWREKDAAFCVRYHEAEAVATDNLEYEARRRAVEGVTRRRLHHDRNGKLLWVEERTEYSDTLLIFLLKGLKPEKYRENVHVAHDRLDPEVKELLRELAAAAPRGT